MLIFPHGHITREELRPGQLEELLPALEQELQELGELDEPFAIIEKADGTYMQTMVDPDDGWVLEYQLVNTSSHYEVYDLLKRPAGGRGAEFLRLR